MAFVNNDKSIILILEGSNKFSRISTIIIVFLPIILFGYIRDTSCSYEIDIRSDLLIRIFVKHSNCFLPSRLNGRGGNDQNFTFSPIIFWYRKETFDNEGSDNRLTKSHNICQHKASVFVHNTDTAFYGFYLIVQFMYFSRKIALYFLS